MLPIPYSFQSDVLPFEPSPALQEGESQGVHFTFPAEHLDWMLGKVRAWFDDSDEVVLVGYGQTKKDGLGFILLEWEECEINPLFIKLLQHEELIEDMSIYLAK